MMVNWWRFQQRGLAYSRRRYHRRGEAEDERWHHHNEHKETEDWDGLDGGVARIPTYTNRWKVAIATF